VVKLTVLLVMSYCKLKREYHLVSKPNEENKDTFLRNRSNLMVVLLFWHWLLHSSEAMKFCIQNCFRSDRMFLRQYHSHLARPRKLRRWPKHKKTHNIGIINEQAVKQLLNWGKSCMQIACNHHFLGSNQFEIQKHARQCQWLVSMAVKTRV